MPKFTITLANYLQSHELPTIFNDIVGFSEIFILEYLDREIGFETEWLFEQKLLGRSNLVVPLYVERISKLKIIEEKLFTQLQVQRSESKLGNYNLGKQLQKVTNLPFNDDVTEPNTINESDEVLNSDEIMTTYAEDLHPSDLKLQYDEILNTEKFILRRLLNEFNDLFMKIY